MSAPPIAEVKVTPIVVLWKVGVIIQKAAKSAQVCRKKAGYGLFDTAI